MTDSMSLTPLGADYIKSILLGGAPHNIPATTAAPTATNNSSGSSVFSGGSDTCNTTTSSYAIDPSMYLSSCALSSSGLGLGLGLDNLGLGFGPSMGYDYGGAYMSQLYNNPYYLSPQTIKEWEALPPEERAQKYREFFENGQRIEAGRRRTNREIQQQDAVETARVEREGRRQIQQERNVETAPIERINGAAFNLFNVVNESMEDDVMGYFCALVQAIIDNPANNTPDGKPMSLENARQLAVTTMDTMLKTNGYEGTFKDFIRDKCSGPTAQGFKVEFGGNFEFNETLIAQIYYDGKLDDGWSHCSTRYKTGQIPTLAENMEAYRRGGTEGIEALRRSRRNNTFYEDVGQFGSWIWDGVSSLWN